MASAPGCLPPAVMTSSLKKQTMPKDALAYLLAALLTLLGPAAGSVNATSIDPLTWEELLLEADFVGVVECITAGGIVAQYKVLETWKGPLKPGDTTTIRIAVDFWGPQFPVVLCRQRFLVTALRCRAQRSTPGVAGAAALVPLWWRKIPADFGLRLWQGLLPLRAGEQDRVARSLEPRYESWKDFKAAATSLIRADPAGRELRLMQSMTMRYLVTAIEGKSEVDIRDAPMGYTIFRSTGEDQGTRLRATLCRKVSAMKSVKEIVDFLESHRQKHPDDVEAVIRTGGGPITRKLLGLRPPATRPERAPVPGAVTSRPSRADGVETQALSPGQQRLQELRRNLARGTEDKGFGEAFSLLTVHDPAAVTAFFRRWPPPATAPEATMAMGYQLGSWFCWRCRKARTTHMQALLKARHPYVRAAGATYLALEDAPAGMRALEKMAKLRGDPGAWAAINLARRGQKAAVPRALEVLRKHGGASGPAGWNHRNLQLRLLVLLSNSAYHSGVSSPTIPRGCWAGGLRCDDLYKRHLSWWRKHADKTHLHDPWLKVLIEQKVD